MISNVFVMANNLIVTRNMPSNIEVKLSTMNWPYYVSVRYLE